MKSPLRERPIFHHLQDRTQTHIFLCVLAYHLLVAIEKRFLDGGDLPPFSAHGIIRRFGLGSFLKYP
jgi:hypothetical protein